uniref:Uncharacterized protein n=1 Tax=Rhizophora mucronata TaxID=61149 RepID=A0A2P2MX59_RHIMU
MSEAQNMLAVQKCYASCCSLIEPKLILDKSGQTSENFHP